MGFFLLFHIEGLITIQLCKMLEKRHAEVYLTLCDARDTSGSIHQCVSDGTVCASLLAEIIDCES